LLTMVFKERFIKKIQDCAWHTLNVPKCCCENNCSWREQVTAIQRQECDASISYPYLETAFVASFNTIRSILARDPLFYDRLGGIGDAVDDCVQAEILSKIQKFEKSRLDAQHVLEDAIRKSPPIQPNSADEREAALRERNYVSENEKLVSELFDGMFSVFHELFPDPWKDVEKTGEVDSVENKATINDEHMRLTQALLTIQLTVRAKRFFDDDTSSSKKCNYATRMNIILDVRSLKRIEKDVTFLPTSLHDCEDISLYKGSLYPKSFAFTRKGCLIQCKIKLNANCYTVCLSLEVMYSLFGTKYHEQIYGVANA
jgi:hypothetical protein